MRGDFERGPTYPYTVLLTGDNKFKVYNNEAGTDHGEYDTSLEAWNKAEELSDNLRNSFNPL